MSNELTLRQIAENVPKSILNASDKDLENFLEIIDESIKLREYHRNLQQLVRNFSTNTIPR